MKTRKFVAEILWLFLGLCPFPQSDEQSPESNQPLHERIDEQEFVQRTWYSATLIRPPPRGDPELVRTT